MRCSLTAALGLVLATACTRGRPAARTGPPGVEAVFDVPREYRAFGELPCAESQPFVYLVTAENDLYGFQPDDLTFHRVGRLGCLAAPGATPGSLAVDRRGTAWVHYTDGSLHRASARDARCIATGLTIQHNGFFTPGMAFASTGPDLTDETLFIWGGTTVSGMFRWRGPWVWSYEDHGLARLDRATLDLEIIGYGEPRTAAPLQTTVSGEGGFGGTVRLGRDSGPPRLHEEQAELTATGDGKLYGFFRSAPATLAEIDRATGRLLARRELQGVDGFNGWAVSFWRGDFYLFWARAKETSRVTRLSGRDGSVQEVVRDAGFHVTGAGVSTCAPLEARAGAVSW